VNKAKEEQRMQEAVNNVVENNLAPEQPK